MNEPLTHFDLFFDENTPKFYEFAKHDRFANSQNIINPQIRKLSSNFFFIFFHEKKKWKKWKYSVLFAFSCY